MRYVIIFHNKIFSVFVTLLQLSIGAEGTREEERAWAFVLFNPLWLVLTVLASVEVMVRVI
jgi:hypothetical protein